jgi:flagellar protein FlaG
MSAESISNALFLIAAVICAAVLIVAIFPAIYTMTGTFGSASHAADQNIRTDFKIVTVTNNGQIVLAWMKNVGTAQISFADITRSDAFCGDVGNFARLTYTANNPNNPYTATINPPSNGYWSAILSDLNNNNYWDPGETLEVIGQTSATQPISGTTDVYFQFVLPNGISRSTQFAPS